VVTHRARESPLLTTLQVEASPADMERGLSRDQTSVSVGDSGLVAGGRWRCGREEGVSQLECGLPERNASVDPRVTRAAD
jgi:hypothetical protein